MTTYTKTTSRAAIVSAPIFATGERNPDHAVRHIYALYGVVGDATITQAMHDAGFLNYQAQFGRLIQPKTS